MTSPRHHPSLGLLLGLLATLLLGGCEDTIEPAVPRPTSVRATGVELDIPRILRGTVASEALLLGYNRTTSRRYRPVIVWGYGLVVDLNGTGSRQLPPSLRAHMLAEMAKMGIGSEQAGWGHLRPEAMLDSEDTAVVVVEAIVPQGATAGSQFDLRVSSDPRTGTTSLESGRLYTTELRPRQSDETLPPVGRGQAFAIAKGSGPIFINPFAEPGAGATESINRSSGRILNGGVVLKDMPLKLRLAQPSHARAAILQDAINTRFPQEPGQRHPTARGESAEMVQLHVPPSFQDRTDVFVDLLLHTTIRQSGTEAIAASIRRLLLADPGEASVASWRWQALGKRAVPIIQDLYDHPEELPRLAALRAGAYLDDGLVIPQLIEMAEDPNGRRRPEAIDLLADLAINPRIDESLRALLSDEDSEVRLRAYEALVKRQDPYLRRYNVEGKFILDVVDSEKPMIYISQVGQPRIVVFDSALALERPITVRAWSNRLMIKADEADERVEVYYRQHGDERGAINQIEPDLDRFIRFLGHTTTVESPTPGLGLSYGETIGAIHQIWRQQYIKADFRAEQDRILAAILRQQEQSVPVHRPDFAELESDEAEVAPVEGRFLDGGEVGTPDTPAGREMFGEPPADEPPPGDG